MPLRIELEDLWRRLATRYKARTAGEEDEGYPVILETLQPITDFDELAKEPKVNINVANLGGGGVVILFTVPPGKRWHLHRIRKTLSVGTVSVRMMDISQGIYIDIQEELAPITTTVMNPGPWTMDEGDYLAGNNGNVADTAITFRIMVVEEDAF